MVLRELDPRFLYHTMEICPVSVRRLLLSSTAVIAVLSVSVAQSAPMFDPAVDRPNEEWCYAAQSTTVIGMPFVPEPVQVTYRFFVGCSYNVSIAAELDPFHVTKIFS